MTPYFALDLLFAKAVPTVKLITNALLPSKVEKSARKINVELCDSAQERL